LLLKDSKLFCGIFNLLYWRTCRCEICCCLGSSSFMWSTKLVKKFPVFTFSTLEL
jgi:hypothetical protein